MNPFQIGAEEVSIADGATTLSGTPVSEGFVIGTARVIDDIYTEMNSIKRGDIVITTATDAGELFFSLLSSSSSLCETITTTLILIA